jgi:hypothetical protein
MAGVCTVSKVNRRSLLVVDGMLFWCDGGSRIVGVCAPVEEVGGGIMSFSTVDGTMSESSWRSGVSVVSATGTSVVRTTVVLSSAVGSSTAVSSWQYADSPT